MPGIDSFTHLMWHMNGADEGTSFPDSSQNNYAAFRSGAVTDTAQIKFGSAAMRVSSATDRVLVDDATGIALGAGDWAIDFWMRAANSLAGSAYIVFDCRTAVPQAANVPTLYTDSAVIKYFTNNADRITGGTSVSANAWHHIALTRASGTTRLFLNGTQEGSNYTDGATYIAAAFRPLLGANGVGAQGIGNSGNVWFDEFRVSVGASRWSANFTPPTAEYDATGAGAGMPIFRRARRSYARPF